MTIRQRILRALVPLTALFLVLGAAGIEWAVQDGLLRALDAELQAMTHGISAAIDVEADGIEIFEQDRAPGLETRSDGSVYFRIWNQRGGVLARSETAESMPLHAGQPPTGIRTSRIGSRDYRICVIELERMPESEEDGESRGGSPHRFRVEVGIPLRRVQSVLELFRRWLAMGFGLLLLMLVALPAWIVGRALRSLEVLSHQAEHLGPQQMSVCLPDGAGNTEVSSLVQALNRALGRMGEAYERQKRFTADASHELRTPLTALRTQCDVALRRPRSAAELRRTLETVDRTLRRLSTLVEALLTLARYESGLEEVSCLVELGDAVGAAVALYTPAAEQKGVRIAMEVSDSIPVHGSPELLQECLASILDNAVRYTPAGGQVTIRGGSSPIPWLRIEDGGPGIPAEEVPKIFERFYRIDPSRSRQDGGLGLGLAIAQQIAHLHGAEILVHSQVGTGSSFELRLPPQ